MSELRKNLFVSARPLPLNAKRQVDFSLDIKTESREVDRNFDPAKAERFMGRMFNSVPMPNGDKIIELYRWDDSDPNLPLNIENNNVFRIDRNSDIVWQVQRVENNFVNWEARNKHAKEEDPNCEGYEDSFINMSEKFFERTPLMDKGFFYPKFKINWFDEYIQGRLLSLGTRWWGYDLDPETGVATCTGEQVK